MVGFPRFSEHSAPSTDLQQVLIGKDADIFEFGTSGEGSA
jgi:hypothetical protein